MSKLACAMAMLVGAALSNAALAADYPAKPIRLLAPAVTPGDAVMRLNGAINKVVDSPEMRGRWIEQGLEPRTAAPVELAAVIRSDAGKWNRIVKQAGIRID